MIRSPLGNITYWNKNISFSEYSIQKKKELIADPSGDPDYRPQFIFNLAKEYWHLIFYRYSRGDSVRELAQYFPPLLDYWEESERLGKDVWTEQQQYTRDAWAVNLDNYIICFWLVGLALALEIPDDQWQRLLVLIQNEGEDELLDRIIATRQPERKIGIKLCYPKPYQRLLDAINAAPEQQPKLLAAFVSHWYKELDRKAKKGEAEAAAIHYRPYWYTLGNRKLDDSGYFGRWCVEAVAAVKAFGLDDSLCLGHEHYPGDLLRPDGPTSHPVREEVPEEPEPTFQPELEKPKTGFLARLFGLK